MYLPGPVRWVREYFRRQRLLRDGIRDMAGKSDALQPVRMAIKRALRGPTRHERDRWKAIEDRRRDLAARTDKIDLVGKQVGLAEHGLSASSDRPWTDFLFQLARVVQPHAALELGTNIGMSGSYLAAALSVNGKGHLWTLEGVPDLAKVAEETFSKVGLGDLVTVVPGWFKDTLTTSLENGPFSLVFVDGHHDGEATISYYRQIKQHLTANSILVFDDINWSRGMQAGWKIITEDKDIRDFCVVAGYGIVAIW
jgi:predicted O-methyltransferase YrrM